MIRNRLPDALQGGIGVRAGNARKCPSYGIVLRKFFDTEKKPAPIGIGERRD